jgi:hypothetical protein
MKSTALLPVLLIAAAMSLPASAHTVVYSASLSGPAEAPPNASPGTGTALVTIDLDLATMRLQTSFSGLLGNVTAAHIHCCTAIAETGTVGVATTLPTFPGFPSGVTSGSYDQTFDLTNASSYSAAFLTNNGGTSGAMNALIAGLDAGKAYLNIHTSQFPGGEIRGFPQVVPVPAAAWLAGSALLGLVGFARRRRA